MDEIQLVGLLRKTNEVGEVGHMDVLDEYLRFKSYIFQDQLRKSEEIS